MNEKLKKLMVYYTISGLLCAAVLSAVILAEKYRGSVHDTADKLRGIKTDLIRMKGAVHDMDSAIHDLKTIIPLDLNSRLPEGLVLVRLDDIRRRIKGAEIVVTNFEEKGSEKDLPVTIKGTMADYTLFVNNVGYLQALSFPYFQINAIRILQSVEKGTPAVLYNIEGIFRMPLANPQSAGDKRAG